MGRAPCKCVDSLVRLKRPKEVPTPNYFASRFLDGYARANRHKPLQRHRREGDDPEARIASAARSEKAGRDRQRGRAAIEAPAVAIRNQKLKKKYTHRNRAFIAVHRPAYRCTRRSATRSPSTPPRSAPSGGGCATGPCRAESCWSGTSPPTASPASCSSTSAATTSPGWASPVPSCSSR